MINESDTIVVQNKNETVNEVCMIMENSTTSLAEAETYFQVLLHGSSVNRSLLSDFQLCFRVIEGSDVEFFIESMLFESMEY